MNRQYSLRALRVDKGLTQQDVADLLDVSKPTVVQWEKDGPEPPKNLVIYALAYLYGVGIDDIRISG